MVEKKALVNRPEDQQQQKAPMKPKPTFATLSSQPALAYSNN
jgi:hypothetical protein